MPFTLRCSIKFEKMSPMIAISMLSIVIYEKKIAALNIRTKRFDCSPYIYWLMYVNSPAESRYWL